MRFLLWSSVFLLIALIILAKTRRRD